MYIHNANIPDGGNGPIFVLAVTVGLQPGFTDMRCGSYTDFLVTTLPLGVDTDGSGYCEMNSVIDVPKLPFEHEPVAFVMANLKVCL